MDLRLIGGEEANWRLSALEGPKNKVGVAATGKNCSHIRSAARANRSRIEAIDSAGRDCGARTPALTPHTFPIRGISALVVGQAILPAAAFLGGSSGKRASPRIGQEPAGKPAARPTGILACRLRPRIGQEPAGKPAAARIGCPTIWFSTEYVYASSRNSVVQNDMPHRTMNFEVAVVADKAQFAEFIHEKADTRTRRTHDIGQCLLADPRNDWLRLAVLSEISQQEEDPRQPLFAGIEQVVHQILLNPGAAGQQVIQEQLHECRLVVEHATDGSLLNSSDGGRTHCSRG